MGTLFQLWWWLLTSRKQWLSTGNVRTSLKLDISFAHARLLEGQTGCWRGSETEFLGIEEVGFTLRLLFNPQHKEFVCPRQWLHPLPVSLLVCVSLFPPCIPVKGQEQLKLSPGVFPADLPCNIWLKPTQQTNIQLARVLACVNQNKMKYYSWQNSQLLLRIIEHIQTFFQGSVPVSS